MKKVIFSLLCLLLFSVTFAHQPRITWDKESSKKFPISVTHPEISQAFYGELRSKQDVYQIISDTGFLLYVNLLVSDTTGAKTDGIVHILEGNDSIIKRLDGTAIIRSGFYEKFAGDAYLKGPEREQMVESGTYTIIVSNKENTGKYVLAIGKKESFNMQEIIHTYKVLPLLKTYFFQKPAWKMFDNYIGIMTGGVALIVIGLLLIIIAIIKKIKR